MSISAIKGAISLIDLTVDMIGFLIIKSKTSSLDGMTLDLKCAERHIHQCRKDFINMAERVDYNFKSDYLPSNSNTSTDAFNCIDSDDVVNTLNAATTIIEGWASGQANSRLPIADRLMIARLAISGLDKVFSASVMMSQSINKDKFILYILEGMFVNHQSNPKMQFDLTCQTRDEAVADMNAFLCITDNTHIVDKTKAAHADLQSIKRDNECLGTLIDAKKLWVESSSDAKLLRESLSHAGINASLLDHVDMLSLIKYHNASRTLLIPLLKDNKSSGVISISIDDPSTQSYYGGLYGSTIIGNKHKTEMIGDSMAVSSDPLTCISWMMATGMSSMLYIKDDNVTIPLGVKSCHVIRDSNDNDDEMNKLELSLISRGYVVYEHESECWSKAMKDGHPAIQAVHDAMPISGMEDHLTNSGVPFQDYG